MRFNGVPKIYTPFNWEDLCDHLKRKRMLRLSSCTTFWHLNFNVVIWNDKLRDFQFANLIHSGSMAKTVYGVGSAYNRVTHFKNTIDNLAKFRGGFCKIIIDGQFKIVEHNLGLTCF